MEPIIKLSNLTKTYLNGNEKNSVLKGINLEVNPGQIIGYIGPNGAGKSTTVKIICGLLDEMKMKYVIFLYFTVMSSSMIPTILTIGNNKNADWIYAALPNIEPHSLFKAALKAAL